MSNKRDPYAILGIDPEADDHEVKRAFRRGVLAWHPDVSSAPDACEKLRQVQWAWEMIGEPARRRGWDEETARQRASSLRARRPPQGRVWSVRRAPLEPLTSRAGRAPRDLFVELELTEDEAARGMVLPIEVAGRTFEVLVPEGARDGARASVWLHEGHSQLHVILRVV